jgi:hypothetical protein
VIWLGAGRSGVWIPVGVRDSFFQYVQTSSGTHSASYSMGTGVFLPGKKPPRHEVNHSPPKVKNGWSYIPTTPILLHSLCWENVTFTLCAHVGPLSVSSLLTATFFAVFIQNNWRWARVFISILSNFCKKISNEKSAACQLHGPEESCWRTSSKAQDTALYLCLMHRTNMEVWKYDSRHSLPRH